MVKLIIRKNLSSFLPKFLEKLKIDGMAVFSGGTFTYEIAKNIVKIIPPYLIKGFEAPIRIYEPSMKYVEIVEKIIQKSNIKFALIIGGGGPCDVVKLASYRTNTEFIYIPTTLSHDGISSGRARIKEMGIYSVKAKPPFYILIDLETIKNSPLKHIRAGFGDGFGKCVSISDWRLDCELNKENCELEFDKKIERKVFKNFKKLLILSQNYIREEKVLKGLARILYNFGECMNKVNSSKPCSGSEHLFSHALDLLVKKPALHGEQVGLGTLACLYLYNKHNTYSYGIEWEFMKQIFQKIKLPTNSKEIKIGKKYLITALGSVAKRIGKERGRFTILEYLKINKKDAEKCLKDVGII